jgi:hypothetical protein
VRCTASTAAQRTSGDFGTETLARVAGKLTGYARLTAATAITTPILVWLPTTRRETTARRLLTRAHHDLDQPAAVPVATAAAASSTPTRTTPAPPNPSGCPSAPPGAGRCARAFTSWVTPGRT